MLEVLKKCFEAPKLARSTALQCILRDALAAQN
jgi:hypothetical protein